MIRTQMDVYKMFGDPPYLQLTPFARTYFCPSRLINTLKSQKSQYIEWLLSTSQSNDKPRSARVRATAPQRLCKKLDVPSPAPGQILVKINWSGLCASDKPLIHDKWAAFGTSMIEAAKCIDGHEGAGIVVAVGDDMNHQWKVGDRASIKWGCVGLRRV
jgi:hypothetical protein